MNCDTCNYPLQQGNIFCPNCGAQVRNTGRRPIVIPPDPNYLDTLLPTQPPSPQQPTLPASPFIPQAPPQSPFQQPGPPPAPPFQQPGPTPSRSHRGRRWPILLLVMLVMLVIFASVAAFFLYPRFFPSPTPTPLSSFSFSKSIIRGNIGISDGTIAFDTDRPDGQFKLQAAKQLKNNKVADAISSWKQGLARDTNDAEALIYLEDQNVLSTSSSIPYITLVVGTILTGPLRGSGRDSLQGAYVAQKEHDDECNFSGCGLRIRLLIANAGFGDEVANASLLMEQIVRLRKVDPTFVGVMGWPTSSASYYANTVLTAAGIPIVSPTASTDSSIIKPPYLFSVAPSNKEQGMKGALYAEQFLHARKVALFFDPTDPYSENLASGFSQQFTIRNSIVVTETYTVGQPQQLPGLLTTALHYNPDLIYFAGYPQEAAALLTSLPACNSSTCLQMLGGDALYDYGDYPANVRAYLPRLYFTALAYPDEWSYLAPSQQPPSFFSDYRQYFDPNNQPPPTVYGYIRADGSTMLSYDAMQVLLDASNIAFSERKQNITPNDMQRALTQITGDQATQGVSGRISFDSNGLPVNKVILILNLDAHVFTKFDHDYGCFLKPSLTSSSNCS